MPKSSDSFLNEFYPSGDSQQRAYVYYRADTTAGAGNEYFDAYLFAIRDGESGNADAAPAPYRLASPSGDQRYAADAKFQLIAAGADGRYRDVDTSIGTINGNAGSLAGSDTIDDPRPVILSKDENTSYGGGGNRKIHNDNITSFTEGIIENFIDQ